jgi:hypothetical protein
MAKKSTWGTARDNKHLPVSLTRGRQTAKNTNNKNAQTTTAKAVVKF